MDILLLRQDFKGKGERLKGKGIYSVALITKWRQGDGANAKGFLRKQDDKVKGLFTY